MAGTVVAIVQPGDLGKDDVASGPTTTTSTTEAPTTTAGVTTTEAGATTLPANVSTTIPGSGGSSTTVTTSPSTTVTTVASTTSTTVGSGLGVGGAGTPNPDGTTAQTGGESMLGLGMGLLGVSLLARRALRRPKAS